MRCDSRKIATVAPMKSLRGSLTFVSVLGALLGAVTPASAGPARVLCASSLGAAIDKIDPGARVELGGSDALAFRIKQGGPADVFVSASPRFTDDLARKGLIGPPVVFAGNRLVVILPRANPGRIRSLGDLARPGIKLVIGGPNVPVGAYARQALSRLGLNAALQRVVSNEGDAAEVVAKVALGEADAAIAYATDARRVAGSVRVIPIPRRGQPNIRYTVAVVRSTADRPAATAFVTRLTSPRARVILRSYGFVA